MQVTAVSRNQCLSFNVLFIHRLAAFRKKKKKRKKTTERGEKRNTEEERKGRKEKRNITVRSDIFNRVRNNGERRVLLKIVERKKVNLQFTAFSESSGNLLAALSS